MHLLTVFAGDERIELRANNQGSLHKTSPCKIASDSHPAAQTAGITVVCAAFLFEVRPVSDIEKDDVDEKPDIRIVYRDEDGGEANLSGLVRFLVSYLKPAILYFGIPGTVAAILKWLLS